MPYGLGEGVSSQRVAQRYCKCNELPTQDWQMSVSSITGVRYIDTDMVLSKEVPSARLASMPE